MPDLHPDYRPDQRQRTADSVLDRTSYTVAPVAAGVSSFNFGATLQVAVLIAVGIALVAVIVWVRGRLAYPGMSGREAQALRRHTVRQEAFWWRVNNLRLVRIANVAVPVLAGLIAVGVIVAGFSNLNLDSAPSLMAPILAGLVAGAGAILLLAQAANQITAALQRMRDARD